MYMYRRIGGCAGMCRCVRMCAGVETRLFSRAHAFSSGGLNPKRHFRFWCPSGRASEAGEMAPALWWPGGDDNDGCKRSINDDDNNNNTTTEEEECQHLDSESTRQTFVEWFRESLYDCVCWIWVFFVLGCTMWVRVLSPWLHNAHVYVIIPVYTFVYIHIRTTPCLLSLWLKGADVRCVFIYVSPRVSFAARIQHHTVDSCWG